MTKLISWVEVPATDIKRSVKFYNSVLNLNLEVLDFGTEQMACFPNGEGAISVAKDFNPSSDGVIVSFFVKDNMDDVLENIWNAGGKVVKPKTKIEAEGRGYFALFIDTEGNRLGLYSEN